ncbi:MCE family protein [Sciscionella sediminilitoris]|uniref:MCE family protein n=1 Tax=Sciscionella sediminilitoris TaxID=1445613 RepID=UPI0004DEF3B4|nr:MCE family protein [Sciscionella sp. SE31]
MTRQLPVAAIVKMALFTVITIVLTWILGVTITGGGGGATGNYSAIFSDASRLQHGDEVRIAGVKVGQVDSVTVLDERQAKVDFTLDNGRKIPAESTARIKYRNLIGQRYLALNAAVGDPNRTLPMGGTIPVGRTAPALNLTTLFNGFQPLFQALNPADVNKLATEIIQVLQGEGGTIDGLLSDTAQLTTTIASKDQVIGQLITNLNKVLDTINAHSPQLSGTITQLQQLVSGLSAQRKPIGDAISALDGLTSTTGDLLKKARPDLKGDIDQLGALGKNLADAGPLVNKVIASTPDRLRQFTRTVSYGSWFNFFICRVTVKTGLTQAPIELKNLLPLNGRDPKRCQ